MTCKGLCTFDVSISFGVFYQDYLEQMAVEQNATGTAMQ